MDNSNIMNTLNGVEELSHYLLKDTLVPEDRAKLLIWINAVLVILVSVWVAVFIVEVWLVLAIIRWLVMVQESVKCVTFAKLHYKMHTVWIFEYVEKLCTILDLAGPIRIIMIFVDFLLYWDQI